MQTMAEQQNGNVNYEIIEANTYVQGVEILRGLGDRPKTFEENIRVRVESYESGNKQLCAIRLDSCTAIVNEAHSSKFKLVLKSRDLISIHSNFTNAYLPVQYDEIKGDGVFEVNSPRERLNRPLLKNEVVEHDCWRLAVQDVPLLKNYRDIVFAQSSTERSMGFYVCLYDSTDKLQPLAVNYFCERLNNSPLLSGVDIATASRSSSDARGIRGLSGSGVFLRGSPWSVAETGLANLTIALTQEQLLELKVKKELSRFDEYASTASCVKADEFRGKYLDQYQQDKKEAVEQILALLKK